MTAMSDEERRRRQRARDHAYRERGGLRLTLKITREADDALTLLTVRHRLSRRGVVERLLMAALKNEQPVLAHGADAAGLSAAEAQYLIERGVSP